MILERLKKKILEEMKGFIDTEVKAVFLGVQKERFQMCIAFWLPGDQESIIKAIPSKDFPFWFEFQITEYKWKSFADNKMLCKKKKRKEMAAFKCNLKSYKHILWRKDKVAKRTHTQTKKW